MTNRTILISGASFAGLATAFWMNRLGYRVVLVEVAEGLKKGGTPVNIKGNTAAILQRMGLLQQVKANVLPMQPPQFINGEGTIQPSPFEVADEPSEESNAEPREEEYEIERDVLLDLLFNAIKTHVELVFNESFTSLTEVEDGIRVTFSKRPPQTFSLVFGCDGVHSATRKHWFGPEEDYTHFLHAYGSVTVLPKLLLPQNAVRMYTPPGKMVVVSAYNNKTDIILLFHSPRLIPYDYRNDAAKRSIMLRAFAGLGWRTPELLEEIKAADNFYFDALAQIKMPSWTRGRIALVGDAAYCASPAAGRGGSLAIDGAAALAEAFEQHGENYEAAFATYNQTFRPFLEQVQAEAEAFTQMFLS